MIGDVVMTLYRSPKMATTVSQMYFRFPLWWRIAIKNAKNYSHTKFWQDSSIYGWDITISGFWKQTAAILKFCFRFPLWRSSVIGMWFC